MDKLYLEWRTARGSLRKAIKFCKDFIACQVQSQQQALIVDLHSFASNPGTENTFHFINPDATGKSGRWSKFHFYRPNNSIQVRLIFSDQSGSAGREMSNDSCNVMLYRTQICDPAQNIESTSLGSEILIVTVSLQILIRFSLILHDGNSYHESEAGKAIPPFHVTFNSTP